MCVYSSSFTFYASESSRSPLSGLLSDQYNFLASIRLASGIDERSHKKPAKQASCSSCENARRCGKGCRLQGKKTSRVENNIKALDPVLLGIR